MRLSVSFAKKKRKGKQRISNKKRRTTSIALKAEGLFFRMRMCDLLFWGKGGRKWAKVIR